MVGAPTDIPVPVPIWTCAGCGTVNLDFIPRGVGTAEELFDLKSDDDNE